MMMWRAKLCSPLCAARHVCWLLIRQDVPSIFVTSKVSEGCRGKCYRNTLFAPRGNRVRTF